MDDRLKIQCENRDDSDLSKFTQANIGRNFSMNTLDVARVLLSLSEPRLHNNQTQEYQPATSECL